MLSILDFIIVIGFLSAILIVGINAGRRVKTIDDYALGGRNFSTTSIVSTIVATWISGSMFFIDLSNTYSGGLSYFIPSMFMAIQMLIIAIFLIPRMGEFMGKLSIAEAMGDLFGKEARLITACCGVAASIGGIAVQFKVFGTLLHYFLSIPSDYAIYIASAIVIVYSAFGGIKSVTYTDVVQFSTFSFVIPVIGIIIWNNFNEVGLTFEQASQAPIFDYKTILDVTSVSFWDMMFLGVYFAFPTLAPMDFQRISIGKNISQVSRAMVIASVIVGLITIFVAWIPFLIFNINSNLDPDNLLAYIIQNYAYIGFKGLIIVGVAAMAMSTADSRINAAAVLFAHDFIKVLGIKHKELFVSKVFSFALGLFAIYLALSEKNLLGIIMSSESLYMTTISVPFLMSILGFRTSKISLFIAIAGGFITLLTWKYLGTSIDNEIIPAMAVNLILLIGSHYILKQPGKWVNTSGKEKETNNSINNITITLSLVNIFNSLKPSSIVKFCLKNSPINDTTYSFFGVFCFISTVSSIYLTHDSSMVEHSDIVLLIYQSMMIITSFFMLYLVWSPRIKKPKFVAVVWNIALIYMLVVCSTFFVLLSEIGKLQFVVFTLNLMLLFILARWKIALSYAIAGIFIGLHLYKNYTGVEYKDIDSNLGSFANILYVLLLASTALITFLKPKQEYLEQTEAKVDTLENEVTHLDHELVDLTGQVTTLNKQVGKLTCKVSHYSQRVTDHEKEIERLGSTAQKILNNVNHELRLPIGNVVNFSDMLHEALQKSDDKILKDLSEEVFKNSTRVSSMILNMLDLATLEVKKVDLHKQTINFGELVTDRVKRCRKIYLQGKKIDFELSIQPEVMIAVDPDYIRQIGAKRDINSLTYSTEGKINVYVYKAGRRVELVIEDQGIGIPLKDIYDIFDPFKMGSKTDSKAEGRGIGLALCKSVAEAHGGKITAESDGQKGAKFTIVLPY